MIKWEDSFTSPGWDEAQRDERFFIQSVGLLVHEGKHSVTISTSQSQRRRYMDQLTIPRSAIRKIKQLK
jgi:hypothetical protein